MPLRIIPGYVQLAAALCDCPLNDPFAHVFDQASKKFIVVGDEAERDALIKAGPHLDGAVVVMTGVPRSARAG